MKQRTMLVVLVASLVFTIGVVNLIANYLQASRRVKVTRIRSDMRSMATALESYFVDNMQYPAMTMDPARVIDAGGYKRGVPVGRTFLSKGDTDMNTLTTPVAYMTSYFLDDSAKPSRITFRYYTDERGWIVGAYGPDRDASIGGQLGWDMGDIERPHWIDILADNSPYGRIRYRLPYPPGWDEHAVLADAPVEGVYKANQRQPSANLLSGSGPRGAYTYDPTNGTTSAGDLWRVKQ
jgi:hypothetical protein